MSKRLTPAQKAHLEDLANERERLKDARLHDKLNELGCMAEIVMVLVAVSILNFNGVGLITALAGSVVSYILFYIFAAFLNAAFRASTS